MSGRAKLAKGVDSADAPGGSAQAPAAASVPAPAASDATATASAPDVLPSAGTPGAAVEAAAETDAAARPKRAPRKAAAAPIVRDATPDYWRAACDHLVARDRVMKRLIPQFGDACLRTRGDAFATLARSIVGQQISVKAAQAVWDRFAALPRRMAPAQVLKLKVADMRAAGLSARKVEYLCDLALHFDSGAVHVAAWAQMDDEAIIQELVAIRGIGRWTAEMFLIFHLMRPDVLPLDDIGLLNGISTNYFSGDPVSRSDAREVAAAWAPYRTVATWYIWRSLDPVPVEY